MSQPSIFAMLLGLFVAHTTLAIEPETVSSKYRLLVPRQKLALLHAPEVHRELKLGKQQIADLELLFAEIDGPWFQSRIKPQEQQFADLDRIEQQADTWLAKNTSREQRKRLGQIELQAQSVRMLLRTDVTRELKLDASQQQRFVELAMSTDAAQAELQKAVLGGKPSEDLQSQAIASAQAERDALKSVLKPEQHQRLWQALGEPFETTKLKRIYPMAPELVAVEHWLNSKPLTLKELRGKVVLVHFYAFQCHNCHANFEIYRRWHDQLKEKGVVVIGIQTPETSPERDPDAVKRAAQERQLEFPILVDLQSENWKAWGNTMWPTVYVVDKNGYLRHWWQGEMNWKGAIGDKTIEQVVEVALSESQAN